MVPVNVEEVRESVFYGSWRDDDDDDDGGGDDDDGDDDGGDE